ncbi:DUF6427 family protein [Flagellimonas beolgyonensis]|uniref:DUF6427 family protein n=1 Tax=Flagellimonas beolgyonensis TaxID=864064 RepID=UPI000F8C8D17|nr:DUF6427 family protein [Allomuricauda beolgyonensis]
MISSFFGKTKPINYIVLAIFLFLFFSIHVFFGLNEQIVSEILPLELFKYGVLLLTVYVINQIVKTEKVTDYNSYGMLFFVLLVIGFSEELEMGTAIYANFFLLLALWRLLSLKSIRNVKHKIFDASLLVAIASLFYDWALLFMVLVFVVINMYDRKNFKNWLVPFIGLATIFMLVFTWLKVMGNLEFFGEHYRFSIGFLNATSLADILNVKALFFFVIVLLVAILVFIRLRNVGGGKLLLLRILFLAFILGVIMSLMTPVHESPLLITFFPAAVFLVNYFEEIKKTNWQEAILVASTLLATLLFIVRHLG